MMRGRPFSFERWAPHLSGPEIERPPETNLTFYDRLFARLIDDLGLTGPLVFAYLTPSGRSVGAWSCAPGRSA